VNRDESRIVALVNLLQDENQKVASLAMEELLKLGQQAEETIAHYQEAHDPQLRQRMHQLSGILARRRARLEFIEAVRSERMSLWDGVCRINKLYDFQCNLSVTDKAVEKLKGDLTGRRATGPRMASLMRQHEFMVPEDDLLDVELYLIESVLDTKYGSPALLCVLAQRLGEPAGWHPTVILYEGRFCLIDGSNLVLDPSNGWHVAKIKAADKIHPCGPQDVWLGILSQLFLVTLVEGQLRDVYHFGDLLTALNGAGLDSLPQPLGKGTG